MAVQVNFCKNSNCENYGIPAAQTTGRGAQRDRYAVVSAGRQFPVLKCHACGEYPPLKSNQGIDEERKRLGVYLSAPAQASCPDVHCANHGVGVSTGSPHYRRYGTTRSGSKRYRCNACTKTFSVGSSTVGQKQPHKNRLIFQLLMNQAPFRRVCEIADIEHEALALNDAEVQMPFRRHARLWLARDYAAAQRRSKNALFGADGTLSGAVAARYKDAASRSDVEVFEEPGRTTQLPKTGMQVHAEYTALRPLLPVARSEPGRGEDPAVP